MKLLLRLVALALPLVLAACGGGDSTTTTLTGAAANINLATAFTQTNNNLRLVVEDVPALRGFAVTNTNTLYADIRVCNPSDDTQCVTIDHVLVDTGSVGLRVMASKVSGLALPPVNLSNHPGDVSHECFQFVIGGLWGRNAVANVWLGQQRTATPVSIHLIDDGATPAVAVPADCTNATNGSVLSTAASLGANGILGIGNTTVDCGYNCTVGDYTGIGAFIQYYHCTPAATDTSTCGPASVAANEIVYNPVSALPGPDPQDPTVPFFNNGVVIKMPAVSGAGATSARGELILGVNTYLPGSGNYSDNRVPNGAAKAELGVDYQFNIDSYLNVTTTFRGTDYPISYLDTGTNGIFFSHPDLAGYVCSSWYCPPSTLFFSADISDGKAIKTNLAAPVSFQIGNGMFYTQNPAISDNAGEAIGQDSAKVFAWGLPFFYGRQVYLTIWDFDPLNPPWYAWAPI